TGKRFPAADAARWGLVNRVTTLEELEPTVHELAATIAQNAPKTIRAIRRAIQEIPKDPDHRNLDEVNALVQACFASNDYKEGRTAFMEKRRPVFQDA
ncbi:MAG: enoyl-CoA hydratase, partial [Chloroflexi bacterium]|nr:enoyl-CoA hydratase [Chloroflexota bacterium]